MKLEVVSIDTELDQRIIIGIGQEDRCESYTAKTIDAYRSHRLSWSVITMNCLEGEVIRNGEHLWYKIAVMRRLDVKLNSSNSTDGKDSLNRTEKTSIKYRIIIHYYYWMIIYKRCSWHVSIALPNLIRRRDDTLPDPIRLGDRKIPMGLRRM